MQTFLLLSLSVTLPGSESASRDTYVYGGTAHGNEGVIEVSTSKTGLVHFYGVYSDKRRLINSATLVLKVSVKGGTVGVREALTRWSENTLSVPSFGPQLDSSAVLFAGEVSFDVTDVVQNWKGDWGEGFVIKGLAGNPVFISREGGNAARLRYQYSAPGDANRDGVFNQQDILRVLQSGKYLTGNPATWAQGDWNEDSVFNVLDIVEALTHDTYQTSSSPAVSAFGEDWE